MSETTDDFGMQEAWAAVNGLNDPADVVFARKAGMQAGVIGMELEGLPELGEVTELGVFRVYPTVAETNWSTPSGDLIIAEGQTYLDYHMPRSDDLSEASAWEGYRQIAQFMQDRPDITHLFGVTYSIMARHAKSRQGFNTEQIELPDSVQEFASAYWFSVTGNEDNDKNRRRFGTAHAVWMPREQVFETFLGNDSSSP